MWIFLSLLVYIVKRCIFILFYFGNFDVKEEHNHFIPSQIQSHLMAIQPYNFQLVTELPYILHLTFYDLVLIIRMLLVKLHNWPTFSQNLIA